jgi:Na+-transporting NADH:ubiquinone oxidoreductase subunit C
VVVVAFLLAFVFQALKPMQDANVALDVKKQILNSLNLRGLDGQEAEQKYAEVVVSEVEKDGVKYYGCKIDGQTKYVFPLKGMGLWGGISGYVSIDEDGKVYGAYFNHESETAGLGAEIKDSQEWQEKFIGKKIYDEQGNVVLSVVKKVEDPETQVDCVTGATLTSNGVDAMLKDCLKAAAQNMLKAGKDCCKDAAEHACEHADKDCCKDMKEDCCKADSCKHSKEDCCKENSKEECCSKHELKAKEE